MTRNRFGKAILCLALLAALLPSRLVGATDKSTPQVKAGRNYGIALHSDGTVSAWGENNEGQLGNGTRESVLAPEKLSGLTNVIAVEAGEYHSLALKRDGTVWAWGSNADGQLGDGTWYTSIDPVKVSKIKQVTAVAAGGNHSLALGKNEGIWAWGRNADGQLADGTSNGKNSPIQVKGVAAVSIGAGRDFCFAVNLNGSVRACGSNYSGQLGLGTDKVYQQRSAVLSDLSDVWAIEGGELHVVALKKDGTVWGIGRNGEGQLGNGGGKETYLPIRINELEIGNPQSESQLIRRTSKPYCYADCKK